MVDNEEVVVEEENTETEEAETPEALGDPGKAALNAERKARKEAERKYKELLTKTETEAERAAREAKDSSEKTGKYKTLAVKSAARAALGDAGFVGDTSKYARFLNMDDIELDDQGDIVSGLEEQIEELKDTFPEMFADRSKRKAVAVDAAPKAKAPAKPLSTAEKLAKSRGLI